MIESDRIDGTGTEGVSRQPRRKFLVKILPLDPARIRTKRTIHPRQLSRGRNAVQHDVVEIDQKNDGRGQLVTNIGRMDIHVDDAERFQAV